MSPSRRSSNPWNVESYPSIEGRIDNKDTETPQWALFAFADDENPGSFSIPLLVQQKEYDDTRPSSSTDQFPFLTRHLMRISSLFPPNR